MIYGVFIQSITLVRAFYMYKSEAVIAVLLVFRQTVFENCLVHSGLGVIIVKRVVLFGRS